MEEGRGGGVESPKKNPPMGRRQRAGLLSTTPTITMAPPVPYLNVRSCTSLPGCCRRLVTFRGFERLAVRRVIFRRSLHCHSRLLDGGRSSSSGGGGSSSSARRTLGELRLLAEQEGGRVRCKQLLA